MVLSCTASNFKTTPSVFSYAIFLSFGPSVEKSIIGCSCHFSSLFHSKRVARILLVFVSSGKVTMATHCWFFILSYLNSLGLLVLFSCQIAVFLFNKQDLSNFKSRMTFCFYYNKNSVLATNNYEEGTVERYPNWIVPHPKTLKDL